MTDNFYMFIYATKLKSCTNIISMLFIDWPCEDPDKTNSSVHLNCQRRRPSRNTHKPEPCVTAGAAHKDPSLLKSHKRLT